MTDFNAIGQQFVQHFYTQLDAAPQNIATLYGANSMLSFEGEQLLGTEKIIEKYASIGQVSHFPQY